MKFKPEMFEDLARTAHHPEAARVAAGLLNGDLDPESIDAVGDWISQCYHKPRHDALVMCALNDVLDCHGVAALRVGGEWVGEYLNTGDMYCSTIVLDSKSGEYLFTTYADYVEGLSQ